MHNAGAVTVDVTAHVSLPDTPYVLWRRGELDDHVGLPRDKFVEVVGGEIVVSYGRRYAHAAITGDAQSAFFRAEFDDPAYPWRAVQCVGLDLASIGEGYIPDLVVFHADVEAEAYANDVDYLTPDRIALVLEATAESMAFADREPLPGAAATKWTGYARCGVPYYLLIDRDPRQPGITLFGEPDRVEGRYRVLESWKFGDPVTLPEPFGIEIDTTSWSPWRG
jgi:hypothetical protein